MNTGDTYGVAALGGAELEEITGGEFPQPPWWWLAMFVASESKDFVAGFKEGYDAT